MEKLDEENFKKKLEDITNVRKLEFNINIIKPAKTFMNKNVIFDWKDIYDDKDEINSEKND